MTDPTVILGTILITSGVAFPIGVVAGKRQMNELWQRNVERAKTDRQGRRACLRITSESAKARLGEARDA